MARSRATVALSVMVATVPLLVSACSGSSDAGNGEAKKSGPEVARDAAGALAATDAVHISGQLTDSSTKARIDVDLVVQSDGTTGTLTYSGQRVSLIIVDGSSYVKASAGFYESQGATSAQSARVADRWVKAPNNQNHSFDNFTLPALSKSLGEPSRDSTIRDEVTTGTLDGREVVIVSETNGAKLYVAADGKPLPLKATSPSGSKDAAGTATLSDYGRRQSITAPADAIDNTAKGA